MTFKRLVSLESIRLRRRGWRIPPPCPTGDGGAREVGIADDKPEVVHPSRLDGDRLVDGVGGGLVIGEVDVRLPRPILVAGLGLDDEAPREAARLLDKLLGVVGAMYLLNKSKVSKLNEQVSLSFRVNFGKPGALTSWGCCLNRRPHLGAAVSARDAVGSLVADPVAVVHLEGHSLDEPRVVGVQQAPS